MGWSTREILADEVRKKMTKDYAQLAYGADVLAAFWGLVGLIVDDDEHDELKRRFALPLVRSPSVCCRSPLRETSTLDSTQMVRFHCPRPFLASSHPEHTAAFATALESSQRST